MRSYFSYLIILSYIFISLPIHSQDMKTDKRTVTHFELSKYLGTWYEIARYDHSFERNLVGVTAHYSRRKDGKIDVLNRGYKKDFDGKLSEAKGKAKVKAPAHLRVSFFLFFYSDYLIFELDDNYQWAVVGSKSDKYLWILSRKPYIPENKYNEILLRIKQRGYPTDKLIKVEQNMDNYVELPNI